MCKIFKKMIRKITLDFFESADYNWPTSDIVQHEANIYLWFFCTHVRGNLKLMPKIMHQSLPYCHIHKWTSTTTPTSREKETWWKREEERQSIENLFQCVFLTIHRHERSILTKRLIKAFYPMINKNWNENKRIYLPIEMETNCCIKLT